MSQISINEFRPGSELPQIFSKVRDFKFFGPVQRLRHRRLPPGPRGFTVVAVNSTGHEGTFIEPDRTVLTIVGGGHSEVSVAGARYALKPGDMFRIGKAEWHSRLMPGSDGGAYESYSVIAPAGRSMGEPGEPPGKHVPNYNKCLQLRQLLELSFEIHDVADFVFDTKIALIEALIDEMFMESMSPAAPDRLTPGDQSVQRVLATARDFIAESYSSALTVQEVADAAGVDLRTLQRAFSSWLGQSPRQYIADLRLSALRARLMTAEEATTVTSAALACGLFHFGRTGHAYKQRFGELPSKTLRRARAPIRGGR
ncbi:hypothetical protein DL1_08265 [Thioclava dalianensis]|uniref:HTH araC/xylS-type domain-containing protein n=1 Tax=Thioclava dalianensis TaxID=1185766 RepID=A0A074TFF7_9RHOB|nr:AraC family transcriptional regulator [Thioclava dalianensis]KEP68885.1 hypothetical protein DL1_08265 [Thioclava dalianensis]SFN22516.1 AraC-type DNA-binding protein [Thioclava dalianensis]